MWNIFQDFFTVGEVEENEIFGHLDFLFRDEDSPFMLGLSDMIKEYHKNKKVMMRFNYHTLASFSQSIKLSNSMTLSISISLTQSLSTRLSIQLSIYLFLSLSLFFIFFIFFISNLSVSHFLVHLMINVIF